MYKNFTLTESEKEQILNMHKEHGYKKENPNRMWVNEQSSSYNKIKTEWSKVNSDDDTSTKGFGEGKSQDQSLAIEMAEFNARMIVGKKSMGMKPSDKTPFKGSVSAIEIDSKTYKMGNTYVYLCLMDKN